MKRRAVTLVEVLIAMFIMAIGLMGILALFAMGTLQTAQAVKDERTAQTANFMEVHAKFLWREAWTDAQGLKDESSVLTANPELFALDDPDPTRNNAVSIVVEINDANSIYNKRRLQGTASSPVYIDPIGYAFQPASSRNWVGGVPILPRRSMSIITNLPVAGGAQNAARIRLFTLLDDLTFGTNGLPANTVERAGNYNAAYLIQRIKNNARTEINLQIIVYFKRPPTDTFVAETPITNVTIPPNVVGTRELPVNPAGVPTPKKGTWMLVTGTATATSDAFADFYRVVAVAPGTIEFAQPIRAHAIPGAAYSGVLIQMENVAEVFDKGTVTLRR